MSKSAPKVVSIAGKNDDAFRQQPKIVRQIELLQYHLLQLERARLLREMKDLRREIYNKLDKGAEIEDGPHTLELSKRQLSVY